MALSEQNSMPSKPAYARYLESPGLMFAIAFLVRLFFVWHWHTYRVPLGMDHFMFGWERGRIARSIVLGQGFSSPFQGPTGPTAWSAPLFPYLLAAVFRIWGIYTTGSAVVLLVLQCLTSACLCLTTFQIARRAFGERTAFWTGWAWVFFPPAIEYATTVISESNISALLLSLMLLFALQLETSRGWRNWIGLGFFAGFAALVAPELLTVLPFLVIRVCWGYRRQGIPYLGRAGAAACLSALCVVPWLVRNYEVFGKFVPVRSNFGVELYVGNTEGGIGLNTKWVHPSTSFYEFDSYRRMGEIAYVADRKHQALRFIAENPGTFVSLTAGRFLSWWFGWWQTEFLGWVSGRFGLHYHFFFYFLLSLAAFAGLRLCWQQKNPARVPLLLVLAIFPLPYYFTHVNNRYRHVLDPMLLVLAVYALVRLLPLAQPVPAGARYEEEHAAAD